MGQRYTHIWIASHTAALENNHEVQLFDAIHKNWTDEVSFATGTAMFQPSDYKDFVKFKDEDVKSELQKINKFKPDLIFWSAISSHIHSEGEYVNIQNGYDLLKNINVNGAIKITGGLQATSDPDLVLKLPNIDYLIMGESEIVLTSFANEIMKSEKLLSLMDYPTNKMIN